MWKPVTGRAEGYPYEVSNKGRVRRSSGKRGTWKGWIVSQDTNSNGYSRVRLRDFQGQRQSFLVHTLVADTFLGPPPGPIGCGNREWQVDHKDDDKTNNCVENLEWVTGKENKQRACESNRTAGNFYPNVLVCLIWCLYYDELFSREDIAKLLHLPPASITDIISGRTRRGVTQKLGKPTPRGPQGRSNLGSRHGRSKIDEIDVQFIRAWWKTGKFAQKEIAIEFGITQSTVSNIVNRDTWTHI